MFSFIFLFSFKAIKIKNSDIGLIVGILASVSFFSNTSAKIGNIFCMGKNFSDYYLFAVLCCHCCFAVVCRKHIGGMLTATSCFYEMSMCNIL